MKKYSVIILLFLAQSISTQEYWLKVQSPTTKWFYDSFLLDTLYGWASGDSGLIIHTSNGGQNWLIQNSGLVFPPVENIFFINRSIGWGIANDFLFNGTIILKTTNGGLNWTNSRFYDTTVVLNTIYFHDLQTGYLSGFSGKIFKTTNGGQNWFNCSVDTNYCPILYLFPKTNFTFSGSQFGFSCGGQRDIQGMIWRTSDGGANWTTYCVSAEPLIDIKIISQNKIVSCGGDPEYGPTFAYSYNGGLNWVNNTLGVFGIAQSLAFRTPAELWVPLSINPSWAVSLDSGNLNSDWQIIPTPDTSQIYSAEFLTPAYGWAFGYEGAILKYNKDIIGINGKSETTERYRLYQNYPNPFNPSTIISYYLSKPELVKLSVFDLAGRQIKVFSLGIKQPGSHDFRFTNPGIASGIYIYKLEAGSFSDTRKMVLLR